MAVFNKAPGQDVFGWDKSSKTQVIKEGKDTLLALEGYDLRSFHVISSDPTVCTIHERLVDNAPKLLMQRVFVITALREGECEIRAMYSAKSNTVLAAAKIVVSNVKMAAKLVFFPGERRVGNTLMGTIFVVGGNGERYDAAGGAAVSKRDYGGHTADPTPAGTYILGPQHHATTGTWPRSAVPYGANLRLAKSGIVEWQTGPNSWQAINGPKGVVTKYRKQFAQRDGEIVTTEESDAELASLLFDKSGKSLRTPIWDLNDFGRWAWNLTLNGALSPYYVHTTPENEWQVLKGEKVAITNSHGCIHVSPIVRDQMVKDGYLKKGTVFEVRKYSEQAPLN